MRCLLVGRLARYLVGGSLPLAAALSAYADPLLSPQTPALDPPAVTAPEPARTTTQSAAASFAPYSHGDPTPAEQLMLEMINRARANPNAEGLRLQSTLDPDVLNAYSYFSVDLAQLVAQFAGYPVRPPLAFNASLIASARAHSQDMADHDFQGHVGSNGSSFTDRMAAAGFTGWTAAGENVYAYAKSVFYGHAGFNADWGVPGLGHRMNIMNFDQNGYVYTEVGVGIINENSPGTSVGPLVVTEDFARRSAKFVVGVVYQDLDHDGFYGMGEGLPGVTISTSEGNSAVTSSSGGYAIPLVGTGGAVTVHAEGGAFGTAQDHGVVLAGTNVKVDFVAGTLPVLLTVNRVGSGLGSVLSSPQGIVCGADCSESFASGTSVALSPSTSAGSAFTGWSGACIGTGSCQVLMNAAKGVTATFVYTGSTYARDYVQTAYVAYYGRPADRDGEAYWAGRMDAEGGSLAAIIAAFGNSDEFVRRYGGLSLIDLVTKIYQQALARDPDPAGLDYYVGELRAGQRTLQSITLDVINGATTAPDSTVVANKLAVAAYYTEKVVGGCAYGLEQDGVDLISSVTAVAATVNAAKSALDARCGP